MSKERPKRQASISVLGLDTKEPLLYRPSKATNPEAIALRRSWPKGTVVLAQQYTGSVIASELGQYEFQDPKARSHVFGLVAVALVNSAWHTSAQNAQDVINRVVDLPILAEDYDEPGAEPWRETEHGTLSRLHTTLGAAAVEANKLTLLHMAGESTSGRYENTARKFGRLAASAAVRMETIGMVPAPVSRSAIDIQSDARNLAVGLYERARYAHETNAQHPTLAQLADDPRERWLNKKSPAEARAAFDQVFQRFYEE